MSQENYRDKLVDEFKKRQQQEKDVEQRKQELVLKLEKENLLDTTKVIEQLSQLIKTQDKTIGSMEFSYNCSAVKIILNNITVPAQHKKNWKLEYIYDTNVLYKYIGYVLDITPELKNKISEMNLKYLYSFDVNNKLCLVLEIKHNTTWNKIKSFFNISSLPYDWKWKITEIKKQ